MTDINPDLPIVGRSKDTWGSTLNAAVGAAVAQANVGVAGLAGKVDADDPRLSDARTPVAHNQAASTISDSTAVGRAVLTATDAAAARTAVGAGTSSLALGTTTGTALDAAEASATYAPLGLAPIPTYTVITGYAGATKNTAGLVLIGDSKSAANYDNLTGTLPGTAWKTAGYWTHAAILLRKRIAVHPAGVSATGLIEVEANLDAYALTRHPAFVLIDIGTNNVRGGWTSADIIAGLGRVYARIVAAGARVIATTIMPALDASTADRQVAGSVNAWIRDNARNNPARIVLCDWNFLLTQANGDPIAALFDSAGVHLNSAGAFAVGTYLAAALDTVIPVVNPLFSSGVDDPDNILTNPLLLGSSPAGRATSWTSNGVGYTKVARTDGIPGEWQQISFPASTASFRQDSITPPPAGTVMRGMVEFQTDAAGWVDGMFTLRVFGNRVGGGGWTFNAQDLSLASPDTVNGGRPPSGILSTPPFVVQPNTLSIGFNIEKNTVGVVRIARPELRILQPA